MSGVILYLMLSGSCIFGFMLANGIASLGWKVLRRDRETLKRKEFYTNQLVSDNEDLADGLNECLRLLNQMSMNSSSANVDAYREAVKRVNGRAEEDVE